MSYADTVNWNGVPDIADGGTVIWKLAVGAGVTVKFPVPISELITVSVAVTVCGPSVSRVTLVCPIPLVSVSGPGLTNHGSELVKLTVPL